MKRKRAGFQVSEYRADPKMARIADDRTGDIVRVWASSAVWKPLDFKILAQSAYMQGIHDAADALAQTRAVLPRANDAEAYGG